MEVHCTSFHDLYSVYNGFDDCVRDIPLEDMFKLSATVALSEFSWFRLELIYQG